MKPRKRYMCLTEWDWEAGQIETMMYDTKKELKQVMKCTAQCGIVEVTAKVIQKPKMFKRRKSAS